MVKHKRANNRALAFARDMIADLKKGRGLDWQIGTAEGGTRECVDVVGSKNGNRRVLIEVELRRKAPLANVVKVWKQITLKQLPEKLVMFQAFSGFYPKKGDAAYKCRVCRKRDAKSVSNKIRSPFNEISASERSFWESCNHWRRTP
jgi:hypothetical protein